jgi:hypothetical protein
MPALHMLDLLMLAAVPLALLLVGLCLDWALRPATAPEQAESRLPRLAPLARPAGTLTAAERQRESVAA